MRAPPSPLQCYFSFLVQYQVPSASTWWIMPTFILHVFNFQTSAFMLSLRQPCNAFGRRPPQTSAKPLHWSPSTPPFLLSLLHCLLRACPQSQDLFIAPLAMVLFLFVPLCFCSYPAVFCVFRTLVKRWYSWGVCTAHTDQCDLWTCQGHLGATVMQIIVIIKVQ